MTTPTYVVKLEPNSDGIWTAEIPALGIVTEGRGEEGARRAAQAAIVGYVRGARRRGFPVPESDATPTISLANGARQRTSSVSAAGRKKSAASKHSGAKKVAKIKKTASVKKVESAKKKSAVTSPGRKKS